MDADVVLVVLREPFLLPSVLWEFVDLNFLV